MLPTRHPAPLLLALAAPLAAAHDPAAGDFSRENVTDIRMLTFNTRNQFISDATNDDEYQRVLQVIDPDIIAFQEITPALSSATIETRLESLLAGDWTVHLGQASGGDRNVLASRYPLLLTAVDTSPSSAHPRGVTAALVDLPGATYAQDVYVMNVHFTPGDTLSGAQSRQAHADAIIGWMRDARTAGGTIDLPAFTPIVVTGDMNLNTNDGHESAPYAANRTLVTGNIFDEVTHGADSPPDWDGTQMTDATPYEHTAIDVHTSPSTSANPASRYDRFVYTDAAIHMVNGFIINTLAMTPAALTASGLLADDTNDAANGTSDHLPVVADFALGIDPNPGLLLVNEFIFDDFGTDDRNFIELINAGGRDVVLEGGQDYHVVHSDSNLPTSPPGAETENLAWDITGLVPPGGLFVIYNSATQSSAIAASIEAALPPAQRQDFVNFSLTNANDCAIALITRTPAGGTNDDDGFHEAFLYRNTTPASDRFFRTRGSNGLVITLTADQRTTHSTASDSSLSRNAGSTTPNMFPNNWTIVDVATPALPNNSTIPVELSGFMAQ